MCIASVSKILSYFWQHILNKHVFNNHICNNPQFLKANHLVFKSLQKQRLVLMVQIDPQIVLKFPSGDMGTGS